MVERATLASAQYFSLATFRRNGKEVATPVWFAEANGNYYVFSAGDAGKVKRIRGRAKARVAPCDVRGKVLGEWRDATARLVSESAEIAAAYRALRSKYGMRMATLDFFARLSGRFHRRALIAVIL